VTGAAPPTPGGLSRRQFWAVLGVALAVFAFATGPVWRDPWNIDASIVVSYAVIPPLVLAVLVASRRFTWRDLALDTLRVTLAKFGVTYVAATVLWAISGEPPPLPPLRPERPPPRAAAPALPPVPPSEAAVLEGVASAGGAPRAGVLVWIASGTEGHSYPPRTDVVEVADDGRAIVPPAAGVQVGQPMLLRSLDGRLHALRGAGEHGRTVFNVAVTSESTTLRLRDAAGLVTLACAVHGHAGKEGPGHLVVLDHPFFTVTGTDGRWRFEGLPRRRVVVRAFDPAGGAAEVTAPLPAAAPVALALDAGR
jgi:hypothetical protein